MAPLPLTWKARMCGREKEKILMVLALCLQQQSEEQSRVNACQIGMTLS